MDGGVGLSLSRVFLRPKLLTVYYLTVAVAYRRVKFLSHGTVVEGLQGFAVKLSLSLLRF